MGEFEFDANLSKSKKVDFPELRVMPDLSERYQELFPDAPSKKEEAQKRATELPFLPKLTITGEDFGQVLNDSFKEFDKNNDNQISREEATESLKSLEGKGKLHAAANIVDKHFDELTKMEPDGGAGITLDDAKKFRYSVDPKQGFNRDMIASRVGFYTIGAGLAGFAYVEGQATVALGAIAVADPEPITKVAAGATAALVGSLTLGAGVMSARAFVKPSQMKRDYMQQQEKLKSWSEFSPPVSNTRHRDSTRTD